MDRRRTIATASVLLAAVFLAATATAESRSIIKGAVGAVGGGGGEPTGVNESSTVAITSMRMYRLDPAMKRKTSNKASVKLVERPRASLSCESCGTIGGEEAVIKWLESLPADRRRDFLGKLGADCRVEATTTTTTSSTSSTITPRPRRSKCGECKRKRNKLRGSSPPPIRLLGNFKKSLPPPPPPPPTSVTLTEPLAATTTTTTTTTMMTAAPIGPKILAELAKKEEPPTTSGTTAPIEDDSTAAATTAAPKRKKDKSKCRKKKKAATKTSIDNAAADSQL